MKKLFVWLVLLAVLAAGVYWFLHRSEQQPAETEQAEAPANVQVGKIERKTIAEPVTAYGSVIAQPARVQVVAIAFETRVRHILVAPGQAVSKGDPLVEIEPSVAAQLQLNQAVNTATATERDLEQTRSRFNLKLATNQELGAAEKAAKDAELQLASLRQAGLGTDDRIRAPSDAIVAKVDVQDGQIVPAGGALVETISADDVEVKLGVESEDLAALGVGTAVAINPAQGGQPVPGHVRLITHQTNTDTRLIDVYVSLPPKSGLLLNSYVSGKFDRVAEGALVAPSAAVQEDDQGYCVFTIQDKKAARRAVQPGMAAGGDIQVTGSGLHEGEVVVTVGSHELNDGDAVQPDATGTEATAQ